MVVDSTGLKVVGEGEWKVRQHGWQKRRTWRKLHVGVDEATGEIVAQVTTEREVTDDRVLEELLAQVEAPIAQVSIRQHTSVLFREILESQQCTVESGPWNIGHPVCVL